jgi:hypothetical protein
MLGKIYMYLFIFMLLFVIFIYVNDKKILDAKEEKIESLQEKLSVEEIKNETLLSENLNLNYFSLSQNEEAISYFDNLNINAQDLSHTIEDEIISRNRAGEDNDLVPFKGMEGVMRINKVKVLNHKWIIADFTDGTYWGEVLISYEIDKQNNLNFTNEKSFLYPIE